MSLSLSIRASRAVVAGVIILGGISAFITLGIIARDGAISGEGIQEIQRYLLQFYVPLIGVVVGFYLAERQQVVATDIAGAPIEAFLIAFVIIAAWVTLPSIVLASSDTYNAALRTLDGLRLQGSTLSTAALTFFYAKTSA